jgi:hypothetical protein
VSHASSGSKHCSVVALVPAHNEAESIGDVIEALLAQERPLDRIVVVSDNSTDDTFAIASSYGVRGVIAVETEGNRHKKSGALNMAWTRYCEDADLIVTLDADTILPPNAVGDWEQESRATHRSAVHRRSSRCSVPRCWFACSVSSSPPGPIHHCVEGGRASSPARAAASATTS